MTRKQAAQPSEVKLNAEIFRLVSDYAKQQRQTVDTIVNEALGEWFGVA